MSESWLQSCSRAAVFRVLSRIQRGRLIVIPRYRSEKEDPAVFGGGPTKDHDTKGDVVVVFNSLKVWVRMCQAFDLVSAQTGVLRLY
jgi:hypothetical protein